MLQEKLEAYLSQNHDNADRAYQSHAVRYALAHPSTFVHVLLPSLLSMSNDITFEHTSSLHRNDARDIYSQFISHVRRTFNTSPLLYDLFTKLKHRKEKLKKFKDHIANRKAWDTVFIHRVQLPTTADIALQKVVVIDSPDLDRFPITSYHHMRSDESYIIDCIGEKPQVHIVVVDDLAPSDIEIQRILRIHDKEDMTSKEWCHNIVVYNLFNDYDDFNLRDSGRAASANVCHRRQIKRQGLGGAVGIGPRPDQAGNVGEYRNILLKDEEQKFALIDDADQIFDYFMEVSVHSLIRD
jgi:hypothetical protein